MAKKYDLDLLPDEFTTDDFIEKFGVKRYQANKTIKYWLSKGYIMEQNGKYFKNNLTQEVENDIPKTEESVVEKKDGKQAFKAHVTDVEASSENESVNTVVQKFKALVAGVEIFVEAKSANEVINIIVSKYGYPEKAIKKIEKL